jgi:anaerobic selenocysteine-containing dehydrogenase
LPPPSHAQETWEVLLNMSARLMGLGGMPLADVDGFVLHGYAEGAVAANADNGRWPGLTIEEVLEKIGGEPGPDRLVDMLLRIGPYGDGFGRRPDGLTLAKVQAARHGIDLGALEPRLGEIINTPSDKIELAPPEMTDDIARLRSRMASANGGLVLIGRRDLRCSNSFMHNLPALVKGPDRCTLHVCREDAARIGLADGGAARVTSRVGSVTAKVEVTDDLMPGVVSLPHGWGHDADGSRLRVAQAHAGVNTNVLTDDRAYDVASGTAVLFGTPVTVEPATH